MVKTPYESLEHSVELYVQGEPPKILSNLGKMDIYEGKELEIACLAKGVPLPKLKWFFSQILAIRGLFNGKKVPIKFCVFFRKSELYLFFRDQYEYILSLYTGSKLVFRISRLISGYCANPDAFERWDFRLEFLNNSDAVYSTDKISTGKQL